ncbi:N-acetylmuramoyl-L-alanine amidase [Clostridium estertheticum]|uniref:N-acetylmuramoyl-L-alanine amidase n=1 Tax=Clostridium estertheticum TaxID=238834 RepID=UPI001C7D1F0D|nr:N-acetylmuramoyl-L-alanine amidase [Clostridium estertheticum]MBX4266521.1 N-acetylmuramoyl-L-alanine amidase [Clostridium estertheticum]WLC88138.1 N-acetylmuramoyl-L-alanine amidase [Clostridium estertheticum]
MEIISYDLGHQAGDDVGADGFVNEEKVIRAYAPVCINLLTKAGYTLINCTPPNNAMTVNQSLAYRVNKANASGSILHLCFHANEVSESSAHGCEVEIGSDSGVKYAMSVLTEIHKLGFAIHGGDTISDGIHRPSLYVTKHTDMVAILIEPFFISNKGDCNLYTPSTLGTACANGVIKVLGGTIAPTVLSPTIKFRKILKVTKQTPCISENGSLVKTFKVGDMLTAVDEDKNWWTLLIGSVSKANTIEVKVQYGKISASNLFVRLEPHATATKLGSLNKDAKVQINKIDGDWINIVYNGGFGWVFGKYITLL